jgi:hypothetical protein
MTPGVAILALSAALWSAPTPAPTRSQAGASRAPYDSPPVATGKVSIMLDMRAAREILHMLGQTAYNPAEAKQLQSLVPVQLAIRESARPPESFERDLAAAFDPQARISIFDFRKIRDEKSKWDELLGVVSTREAELTKLAGNRAAALLPNDIPVDVTIPIYLTFGLPGRADHIAVPGVAGAEWAVVIDLARALQDVASSMPEDQIKHLARMMASEAYQRAWAEYRSKSAAWQKHDPALGQLEPLMRSVAEAGPVALFTVDENFFPLSEWLKEPMKSSIDALNRAADRLVSAEGDLDTRMELAAEIQKPEFKAQIAGPAGAFLADGIIQVLGLDAYRAALAGGPKAFFEAYDRAASQKGRGLIPLAKVFHDRLTAAPPKHP